MTLIFLVCFWFGQDQANVTQNQSTANPQQQATPNQSPVGQEGHAGQIRNERQQDQNNAAYWSDPLVVLQLLLFVAVVAQAGIYGWQLSVMRRTLAVLTRQADAQEEQTGAMQGQL